VLNIITNSQSYSFTKLDFPSQILTPSAVRSPAPPKSLRHLLCNHAGQFLSLYSVTMASLIPTAGSYNGFLVNAPYVQFNKRPYLGNLPCWFQTRL